MNIVVYGIGGVGGFFGGKLAKAGHNVTFIVRGKHLEAIRKNGLTVKSIDGDFHATPTLATDDISGLPKADLVFLAVKSWQVTEAAMAIKPIIGKNTAVVPLQNGADNADKLLAVLDKENVLGGLCRIISKMESPGVINHFAFDPQVVVGELNNKPSKRTKAIKDLFDKAGVACLIAPDIQAAIWAKFLFIATISGLGGLTRAEMGVMREDTFLRGLMVKTANEILAVARAKNINIDQETIDKAFKSIDGQAHHATASMQRDIMEGKPSELENFNGYIVKEGQRLGVPTPINEFIYRSLLPMEKKARKA